MYSGGDSVRACIEVADSPDLCAANDTIYCWVFYLEAGGPVPNAIRPLNNRISACADEYIEFTLIDDNGIIDTSLHFYVVRSSARSDTAFLSHADFGSTVTYNYEPLPLHMATVRYTPVMPFFDPETVYVCVTACLDSVLNPMSPSPYCWRFFMDRTTPVVWRERPMDMEIVRTRTPDISFRLWDFISGIDSVDVSFVVNGRMFTFSDPCVTINPAESLITISTDCAGMSFSGGVLFTVSVIARESPDYCAPYVLYHVWSFMIEPGGPNASIVRPMPGDTSSCVEEYIAIHLCDSTGVDTSTIQIRVNGVTISWGDPRLSYDYPTCMLYFVPDPLFGDLDTISAELIRADDFLGNPLEDPLSWVFYMDRVPPRIFNTLPTGSTANPSPLMSFNLTDISSGINPDSVRITVDGITYDLTSPSFVRMGDSLFRYDPILKEEDGMVAIPFALLFGLATLPMTIAVLETIAVMIVRRTHPILHGASMSFRVVPLAKYAIRLKAHGMPAILTPSLYRLPMMMVLLTAPLLSGYQDRMLFRPSIFTLEQLTRQ